MSLKFFNKWSNRRTNINGESLNNLNFADYVVAVLGDNKEDLCRVLKKLEEKEEAIKNEHTDNWNHEPGRRDDHKYRQQSIGNVKEYKYLGQQMQLGKGNTDAEIKRRRRLNWEAFGKRSRILTIKRSVNEYTQKWRKNTIQKLSELQEKNAWPYINEIEK